MGAQGLDRAATPDAATARRMLDAIDGRWWNVYIGGPEAASHTWTPAVVADYVRHGIDRFMLTYVGRQSRGPLTRAQGKADAADAIKIARRFGYGDGVPLCLDVEIGTYNGAPAKTVEYARAWCEAVRAAGMRPGIYANPVPLEAMHKGKVDADFVWVASWNSHGAVKRDPHKIAKFPDSLWPDQGERAWQYAGAYGGKPCRVLGLDVDINVADLGCLAPPPGGGVAHHPHAPKRSRALRKGDRGPVVVRLTHRLSALRSKQTRTAYLDGARSRFDAETEAALKSFQAEHGLAASGRYGRETARALLKALRRAKAQAEHHVSTAGTAEAKPDAGTTSLPALVREYQRHDALADQAWQKIEAYGRQRMRVLARLERREADTDIGKLTARLAGIEAQLAMLVELERQELEVERRELELEHHELVLELAELEPGPEGLATATAPGAYPPMAQAEETVALAPTVAGAGGSNGAGTIVDKPRRTLSDLSDAELDKHIDLLDSRLERSRKLRVARYARVEKAIARATGKPLVVVRPPTDGRKPERPHHGKPTKPPAGEDRKPAHHPARPSGIKALQRALNSFTEKYLDGVPPLEVDGKKGPETDKRIRTVKFYLGYGGAARRSTAVPAPFLRRLQHPRSVRHSSPAMLARANSRRRKQRARAKRLASGVIEGTPKHIIDQIVLPIAQQSGVHRTPAENDAANARHGPTNTGGRSDHQGPPNVAWAADMSNGSSPTPQMDALARNLAKRFDIPWSGAGLVNATHGGYRYQLIYRTNLGGNHYNHVHFGVRDV